MPESLKHLFSSYDYKESVKFEDNVVFHLDYDTSLEYLDKGRNAPGILEIQMCADLECTDEEKFSESVFLTSPEVVLKELKNKFAFELKKIISEYLVIQGISYTSLSSYYQEIDNKIYDSSFLREMGLKVRLFVINNTSFSATKNSSVPSSSGIRAFKKKYIIPITIVSVLLGIAIIIGIYFLVKYYVDYLNGILNSAGV